MTALSVEIDIPASFSLRCTFPRPGRGLGGSSLLQYIG